MYKEIFRLLFAGHNFIVLDLPLLFETEVMLEFIHKVITVTWYVIAHSISIFKINETHFDILVMKMCNWRD